MTKFLTIFCILALIGLATLEWDGLLPAINLFCLLLAKISGFFIHLFDDNMILIDRVMRHGTHGFALEVADDCSGLSASWLLLAAIIAFESSWKQKLWGIVLGILVLQAVNIFRLISLFYIGDWMPEYFNLAHKQVWIVLINITMIVIFGSWLYYIITHPVKTNEAA
ncbi:exosortase H [Candidatus Halobeggiatoa sp. HSG11]|nr:exosortase H [Candidatus Halobeggiatoa sp. HSG11]